METITATYHVRCTAAEVEALSRAIAVEQTVEVPEALIDETIEERIVGRVDSIEPRPAPPGGFALTIRYNAELAADQLPQLVNLAYGNVAMHPNVRLVDLLLPDTILARFRGPNFGIAGIRALLGVFDRPLLATALKPRGSSSARLAALAEAFARGGGDMVKDDHNLVDSTFEAFRERTALCQAAVDRANQATGRRCLYLPYVSAPARELDRYLDCLVSQGTRGILVAPLLLGVDVVRGIAETYPVVVMSHPTFSGAFFNDAAHGIEHGLLMGKLFRLAGVDAAVFPNRGGRFALTRAECASIAHHLRAPLGALKPAFPVPAGGMQFDRIADMAEHFGRDTVFLVGGALLTHAPDVADGTRAFLDRMRELFPAGALDAHRAASGLS